MECGDVTPLLFLFLFSLMEGGVMTPHLFISLARRRSKKQRKNKKNKETKAVLHHRTP
jgi:hypothetical protein